MVRLFVAAVLAATPVVAAPVGQVPRIVAVGDLHGDFSVWRDIARDAQLVDRSGSWAGGNTTLVQVGDMVDRGPESLKIIRDLMRLQKAGAQAWRTSDRPHRQSRSDECHR